jgi:hypothetical protein
MLVYSSSNFSSISGRMCPAPLTHRNRLFPTTADQWCWASAGFHTNQPQNSRGQTYKSLFLLCKNGGRYKVRTCDPYDVNAYGCRTASSEKSAQPQLRQWPDENRRPKPLPIFLATVVPTRGLTLSASGIWAPSKFKSFADGGGPGVSYGGNFKEYAPEFSASGSVESSTPIDSRGNRLLGYGDVSGRDHNSPMLRMRSLLA